MVLSFNDLEGSSDGATSKQVQDAGRRFGFCCKFLTLRSLDKSGAPGDQKDLQACQHRVTGAAGKRVYPGPFEQIIDTEYPAADKALPPARRVGPAAGPSFPLCCKRRRCSRRSAYCWNVLEGSYSSFERCRHHSWFWPVRAI